MGPLLAILASIFTVIGNAFAEEWAIKSGAAMFALMMLFFTASSVTYPFALRHGELAVLTAIATVFTLLATAVIGLVFFKERLTPAQIVGIVFAFAAIALLAYPQRA